LYPLDFSLAAELALRAYFERHPRHLTREVAQTRNHLVDGHFEVEHFAAHIDIDGLVEVAVRDSLCDL
jgi:hypothetical protein